MYRVVTLALFGLLCSSTPLLADSVQLLETSDIQAVLNADNSLFGESTFGDPTIDEAPAHAAATGSVGGTQAVNVTSAVVSKEIPRSTVLWVMGIVAALGLTGGIAGFGLGMASRHSQPQPILTVMPQGRRR